MKTLLISSVAAMIAVSSMNATQAHAEISFHCFATEQGEIPQGKNSPTQWNDINFIIIDDKSWRFLDLARPVVFATFGTEIHSYTSKDQIDVLEAKTGTSQIGTYSRMITFDRITGGLIGRYTSQDFDGGFLNFTLTGHCSPVAPSP